MKFRNQYLGLQIVVENKLLTLLEKESRKFYPNEYGGVLLGRYSDDRTTLLIFDTILSETKNLHKYKFERIIDNSRFIDFFEKTPSLIYVGEWHTHPDTDCTPSTTDFNAIFQIVNHPTVLIENPVLLIISVHEFLVDFCFYVYFEKRIYKYYKFLNELDR